MRPYSNSAAAAAAPVLDGGLSSGLRIVAAVFKTAKKKREKITSIICEVKRKMTGLGGEDYMPNLVPMLQLPRRLPPKGQGRDSSATGNIFQC